MVEAALAFAVDLLGHPVPVALSEPAFLAEMARRFMKRAALPEKDALIAAQACLEFQLDGNRITFGGDGFEWDAAHAHELVDDELSYWGEG
jgi:hypothetical protein